MSIRNIFIRAFQITASLFLIFIVLVFALMYSKSLQLQLITAISEKNIKVERNIAYHGHERNKLDIYTPEAGDRGGPLVIYYYGGGWRSGRKELYHFIGAALAQQGYTTVIPDYRLFPEVKFPGFMQDAAQAYYWTWEKFIKNNPDRPVILMGHSAGAHISALLSYDPSYFSKFDEAIKLPQGLIGLAGPYSFDPTTWGTTKDIFSNAKGNPDVARPVTFVDEKSPKSLLFHGQSDTTVKMWNAEKLSEKLTQAEISHKLVKLKDIGHIGIILTLARPFRWRAPVLNEIKSFIKTFDENEKTTSLR